MFHPNKLNFSKFILYIYSKKSMMIDWLIKNNISLIINIINKGK